MLQTVYQAPLFALFLLASALLAGLVARFFADPINARLRRRLASNSSV